MRQPGWDPRGKVSSIVSLGEQWRPVGEGYGSIPSVASDKDGNVYFSDPGTNRIYKSDVDGNVTVFRENTNGASALRMGPDRRLYATQPVRKRIVSFDANGDEKIVAENVQAEDIAITAHSALYFSDAVHKTFGYIGSGGKPRVVYQGGEMALPSALSLSPDQAMLIATDAQSRYSWSFQIATDGALINGEPFYRLEMPENGWLSGVHGVTEDSIGQVYFSTPLGIQVCEANGRVAAILNPPGRGRMSNLTFGGKGLSWLYVVQGGKLFRRSTKTHGVAADAAARLPKPPL
jgi:sugar lactone lactonase YvrE